ncbi:MAG: aldolase [Proteobacteria bacterium]|nr:aldolase [Pseudomonadota bacterium]MBU1641646.1 aldolase [Pseudomonadota bacterium]
MQTKTLQIRIPADVPLSSLETYRHNYIQATRGSGRLMLFAGDQKVEHLNADFVGPGIHSDDGDPEHLFRIAAQAQIGVFVAQLGLIAQYGADYSEVPYLVKLNARTYLEQTSQSDPRSLLWHSVEQVVRFRDSSGLAVVGVGYTVYLGSHYEAEMLSQAAQIVHEAHHHGLLTVIWMYPRGQAVKDEKDPGLIAGAAGVAACLGSDFVKVNAPMQNGHASAELLKDAVRAAGKTGVLCAGGASDKIEDFLFRLHEQIHVGGAAGNATGRNIHQKSLAEAVRMCNAICAITVDNATVAEALKIFQTT